MSKTTIEQLFDAIIDPKTELEEFKNLVENSDPKLLKEPLKGKFRQFERGTSLLHAAALAGKVEMAKILLENRANVNVLDGNNMSPLHLVILSEGMPDQEMLKFIELFHSRGFNFKDQDVPLLNLAVEEKQYEIAERLIAIGVDINQTMEVEIDGHGTVDLKPIEIALKNNDEKIVKLLVKKGANLDIPNLLELGEKDRDYENNVKDIVKLALSEAIKKGDNTVFNKLSKDSKLEDHLQQALEAAKEERSPAILQTLIRKGVDLSLCNDNYKDTLNTVIKNLITNTTDLNKPIAKFKLDNKEIIDVTVAELAILTGNLDSFNNLAQKKWGTVNLKFDNLLDPSKLNEQQKGYLQEAQKIVSDRTKEIVIKERAEAEDSLQRREAEKAKETAEREENNRLSENKNKEVNPEWDFLNKVRSLDTVKEGIDNLIKNNVKLAGKKERRIKDFSQKMFDKALSDKDFERDYIEILKNKDSLLSKAFIALCAKKIDGKDEITGSMIEDVTLQLFPLKRLTENSVSPSTDEIISQKVFKLLCEKNILGNLDKVSDKKIEDIIKKSEGVKSIIKGVINDKNKNLFDNIGDSTIEKIAEKLDLKNPREEILDLLYLENKALNKAIDSIVSKAGEKDSSITVQDGNTLKAGLLEIAKENDKFKRACIEIVDNPSLKRTGKIFMNLCVDKILQSKKNSGPNIEAKEMEGIVKTWEDYKHIEVNAKKGFMSKVDKFNKKNELEKNQKQRNAEAKRGISGR